MWFKEYMFNVIIQPFHLLLYIVLVGTAITLATESLIYAVVAIYFVIPAEKLLRKFFGFDNAGTLSAAGSFAGGALFSAMINKINRPKPSEGKDEDEKPTNTRRTSGGVVNPNRNIFGSDMTNSGSGGRTRRRKWWTDLVDKVAGAGGERRTRITDGGSSRRWSDGGSPRWRCWISTADLQEMDLEM